VAVVAARRAALAAVEPGVPARRVHEEAAAELAAYGFPVDYGAAAGFVHAVGHGVGLALHEAPGMRSGATLDAGATLAIEPGVYDPSVGGVRVEDVVVVTDGGAELLVDRPTGLSPAAYGGTDPGPE
jgi:Xaa-Pro aminopeptidase